VACLLLFFDGIGIGEDDPRRNPFAAIGARRLAPLAGRAADPESSLRELDATLGVPGLPQSATGQTTLLTGINAARHAGRHMQGLPGPTLIPLLERESLFLKLVRAGVRPTFANAFTREHLEAPRPRWSATTRMVMAAGVPFRMWDEEPLSLSHDYTGRWMRGRGFAFPRRGARQAAQVLNALLRAHDLVLYEYFLTDLAAHRGDREQKLEQARAAESLVDHVVRAVDLERHLVIVTSDHGNLEDLTDKRHTRHPVPFLVWGAGQERLVDRVRRIEDVTSALVETLGGGIEGGPPSPDGPRQSGSAPQSGDTT